MQNKTKLFLISLIPVQVIVLQVLKYFPEFVEVYYSTGIFPLISEALRFTFGWIPFSVGDVFYFIFIILIVRWLYKNLIKVRRDPKSFFLDLFSSLSLVYLFFNLIWGFNYYRVPLHESLSIKKKYNLEQLINTTERLIKKSNEVHLALGVKDSTKVEAPYNNQQLFDKTINGFQNIKVKHPNLDYQKSSIKKSSWSQLLTYMGYSGYYNPLTGEAQVNDLIKHYGFPVVSCHEQAHQLGYAAENEANFIAVLATINNDDLFISYTGYIFALRYCLSEIARRDFDWYKKILPTVYPGILKSYQEIQDFWKSYENPFETISKTVWDRFLKVNNQTNGIKSYNYMVGLIVNYYEEQPI